MGNGASDSCCGLWTVDDRKCIERADRLHKSELYACRSWVYNVRHVERLLKKKRVAPFERGVCFVSPPGFVECPICFLVWKDAYISLHNTHLPLFQHPTVGNAKLTHTRVLLPQSYSNINRTCCCDQPICTGLHTNVTPLPQQEQRGQSHTHVHHGTECALQIEPNLNRAKSGPCPFCRRTGFRVRWACAQCHKDVAVTTISTTPAPVGPPSST